MEKEKHLLVNQIHRFFGVEFNNRIWPLFENPNRTVEETEDMINYAHSSLVHWKIFDKGTVVNLQRGEYMISKAYLFAGDRAQSLKHAKRCHELTNANPDDMKDFDVAYSLEVMAKALALNEETEEAKKYRQQAKEAGEKIKGEKDKEYFEGDFKQGPWSNLD